MELNMNPLLEEKLIHEHRRDIEQEIEQIDLLKKAGKLKIFLPNLFKKNKK